MADQAVAARLTFLVAIETPAHAEGLYLYRRFHCLNVAVTVRAVDTGSDVRLVRKTDMIREVVHAHPWDRLFVFPVRKDFHDFRSLAQHYLMAAGTALNRRDTCDRSSSCVGMTKLAIDADFTNVMCVAERNRLLDWVGVASGETLFRRRSVSPCFLSLGSEGGERTSAHEHHERGE